ncbi:protein kinase [Luteolibacter arcticus]|uniref:Protein kinase n=1 Tax=Luteolibacter arcticus TaxID=1581411 RepID=A0ABT3GPQ3_9BACT|nr:serine/threonine-protein kinase [Luteolibacter arcticus]MCW1925516.1 protein kinase [Luteolibacter arcticus]
MNSGNGSVCEVCGEPMAGGGPCSRCLFKVSFADPGEPPPEEPAPWGRLANLELHEEIGRGGMGVVYRARQTGLDRTVAVKVLLRARFAGAEERERFHREARAAARLKHPGIVGIFDIGEDDGVPWFSMEHLPGKNLEQLVRDHPLAARDAAQCVRHVAEAVQHAHDHQVLHRDLKPSNILLDHEAKPQITDFGIARLDSHHDSNLTRTGQMLGSPGYAAPEQAFGGEADARTDVYGLGASLYHLLTSRPPFVGPTLDAVLIQLREDDPLSLRKLNPAVPRDLETVCLKCLRKDPAQRYATAKEVADDLGRFLSGEPIHAKPVGPLGRGWHWARRRPWTAGLAVACALLLATLITSFLAADRREDREGRRVILIAASHEARAERVGDSRRRAMAAVQEAWKIKSSPGLRNEAIAALSLPGVEFLPALGGELPAPPAGELSVPDDSGRRRAVVRSRPGGRADVIEILSVPEGKVLQRLEHDHRITCLDWSGELLIAGGSSIRLVYVWDTFTGRRLHRFGGHNADLEAVAFRPGGQEFVSVARDGMLRVWHGGLGAELLRLTSLPEHAGPVAWSEDGSVLRVGRSDGSAIDGFRFEWPRFVTVVGPGALEPRSENLASLHLGTSGKVAVTVDEDVCRLWSLAEGREVARFPKLDTEWMSAALAPDALWLSGWNAGLRRIPLSADFLPAATNPQSSRVGPGPLLVAASRDGKFLALTHNDERPENDRLLLVATADHAVRKLPQQDPYCAAFSPAGDLLVTGSFRVPGATLHSLQGGTPRPLDHPGLVLGARFTDDGHTLWLWGDHAVTRWDTGSWNSEAMHTGEAPLGFTISPDGTIASSTTRRAVVLHDARDLSKIARFEIPSPVGEVGMPTLAFSPDSSHLAIHVADGAVVSWDIPALREELGKYGMNWKTPAHPAEPARSRVDKSTR